MKNLLILPMMLLNMIVSSQNLVPNWSFEDTVSCPVGLGNIDKALGWSSYRKTPDYLHACNNNQVGVPSNLLGYQNAKTGLAYAGLYTYGKFAQNYREIIGIELNQQLTIGNSYFVSFYVSLAWNTLNQITVSTNKIGVRFSTLAYNDTTPVPIDNFAHIFADSIVSDSINWVEVKGFFIADSAYQYLSIGNFFSDSTTSLVNYDSTSSLAYYYIEDITLIDSTNTTIVETGNNSAITVFPNFFNDEIFIEGTYLKTVNIYDLTGRKCIGQTCTSTRQRIDTRSLSNGMYIITLTTRYGTLLQKAVKQ